MEKGIFEHGCNPGFDENCGLSTDTIIKKLESYGLDPGDPEENDPDFKEAEMWRENGIYTGPGRERSMAKPHPELPPGDVAHAWVRLADGTIIDGASGQFMGEEKGYNPKGENFKSTRNIKHRNRLRIIHPDSKLQKYYEADLDDIEERFYDSVPPGYYDSKQSKSSRIQMARERIALNEEPFIVDKTSNRPSFLTPNGNYIGRNIRTKEQLYSDSNTHSGLIEGFGDKNPNEIYDYGDYTDNPRILDFMDRENMIRVSDHPTQNSFEILNEPTRQQLRLSLIHI